MGVVTPPPTRVRPKDARIHLDNGILGQIFAFSSSLHLRAEEPFFQDRTTNLWLGSVRTLKSLCLVSKSCYVIAARLLYKHIRLRRIPQLSALVASLQPKPKRLSNSQSFFLPMRLGDYTQSLDLSFFIPREWNTLYVSELITLLPMLPNLTSFRSRPCLPMLSQSGAPIPRPVPSPILLALAHSQPIKRVLTELEITQQEGPALSDLVTLLKSSSCLSTLTLGFHTFNSGSALSPLSAYIQLPSLQSLKLHVTMNRPEGVLTAKPAAHLMTEARRWYMPILRNLSLVLDHDIQALSSDSPFGGILHSFLNIRGRGIRHLSVTETARHLRSKALDVSSLVSSCPGLECLTIGIVGWAPVRMVVPHTRLRRMQLVGTLGWISVGGDSLRAHGRQALEIQAAEVRAGKLPGLRDVVLMDEREVPREWAEAMRSVNVSISCMRAGDESEKDIWSDGEGSEDDNWVLPPRDGEGDVSSEGSEDDGWYTDTSASGGTTSFVGGDQIGHISALEIFEKSLERVIGLPKKEDSDSEVGVASPPAPAPSLAPMRVSTWAVIPTYRRRFGFPVSPVNTDSDDSDEGPTCPRFEPGRALAPVHVPSPAPPPAPTRPAVIPDPIPTRLNIPVSSVMGSSPDARVPPLNQRYFPIGSLGDFLGTRPHTRPKHTLTSMPTPLSGYSKTAPKSTFSYGGGGLLSSMAPEPKSGADKGNIGSAKVVNHDSIISKEEPTL